MITHLRPALVMIVLMTVLTGLAYPLAMTGLALTRWAMTSWAPGCICCTAPASAAKQRAGC